jgi:RimJ/RimL family protein N-acetyltransferase
MEPGKIIYRGKTKKGNEIIIRYPLSIDAQKMCDYINILSDEQTFIRFQGEKITLEDETKYLDGLIKKIEKNQAIQLLTFFKDRLIGISDIIVQDKIERHRGTFGITIAKEHRREGIGKLLMSQVLNEAKNNIPQLKIVTLGIFANNSIAKKMYQKFGFKEYGKLPNGILTPKGYFDHIYMYKNI